MTHHGALSVALDAAEYRRLRSRLAELEWTVADLRRTAMVSTVAEIAAPYRELVDQLPDVVLVVTDRKLRFVRAAGGALERAGWRESELLGRRPRELAPEPFAARMEEHLSAALRGEANVLPFWQGARTQLVWDIRFGPLRDHSGAVVGAIMLSRDVTGQHQRAERLRESEERLRVTVDSAAAGVATLALEGRFTRVNRRYCEITGYSQEELLARTFQDITHPDDLDLDLAQFQQLAAGEIPWYAMQKRYVRKDGSPVWVLLTGGSVRDADGQIREYVATVTDIDAQVRAQEEVSRLNTELEERVRARTAELKLANGDLEAFAYTVTHDLRAPLSLLTGFSELLEIRHADQLDDVGKDLVRRIRAACTRMNDLIDELLLLSQAERAKMDSRPVDLSDLARAAVGGLRQRDPGREVEVRIADGVRARGDARLLGAVLDNLLGNAWKFTSTSTGVVIEFGAGQPEDGMVHCYVRDNGVGFDPAQAGRLFHPFSRLHTEAEFPGTGIGLASVRRILERHHGRCWAEGEPGAGATFHFTVPALI